MVNGYIETDVYAKPSNNHLYLHNKSAHPNHIMKAIPYMEFPPESDIIVQSSLSGLHAVNNTRNTLWIGGTHPKSWTAIFQSYAEI